jgi:hypothetical protein
MPRPRRPGRTPPEARLDPIRWHRPGRGALLRLTAVAALLITAALITWSGPATCSTPPERADGPAPATDRASADAGSGRTPPATTAGARSVDGKAGSVRAAVPAGTVGVPVRLAEPTALKLVRPGDHVDLLRAGHDSTAVAAAALVLSVTGADDPMTGGLLLAMTPAEASAAVTDQTGGFAVLIRP